MTSYFSNLRNIRTIADRAGNPISDSDMLAKVCLLIRRTGIYEKGLDDWNELPAAQKAWLQFQIHFKAIIQAQQGENGKTGSHRSSWATTWNGKQCDGNPRINHGTPLG